MKCFISKPPVVCTASKFISFSKCLFNKTKVKIKTAMLDTVIKFNSSGLSMVEKKNYEGKFYFYILLGHRVM